MLNKDWSVELNFRLLVMTQANKGWERELRVLKKQKVLQGTGRLSLLRHRSQRNAALVIFLLRKFHGL